MSLSDLSKFAGNDTNVQHKLLCNKQKLIVMEVPRYEVALSKEQNYALSILSKLCLNVKHGKTLAKQILVCYRLSIILDYTFKVNYRFFFLSLFSYCSFSETF